MHSDCVSYCSVPLFLVNPLIHKPWFVPDSMPDLQTTHDVTDICSAEFLSEVGRKTPLIARFSTVVHEAGSPESLRDTRGFSVKFYTNEGNWDFVGNNMPVRTLFLAHIALCFHC